MQYSKFGADVLLSQVVLAWVEVTKCSKHPCSEHLGCLDPNAEASYASRCSLQAVLLQARVWHSSCLAIPYFRALRVVSPISTKKKDKLLLPFPL